jgi:hypothetical protein
MSFATRGRVLRVLYGWGFAVAIARLMNGTIETSPGAALPGVAARAPSESRGDEP